MIIDLLIQARTTSTRLPNKVLLEAGGKPMLHYLFQGMRRVSGIRNIVVLCPTDDMRRFQEIMGFAWAGDEFDVASRFVEYCEEQRPDGFARICADSPLLDWRVVDHMRMLFEETDSFLVSNVGGGVPAGQHVEFVDTEFFLANKGSLDKEHVLPPLYKLAGCSFRRCGVMPPSEHPPMVLDTPEDWKRIQKILEMADYRPWQYPWQDLQRWA